MFLHLEVSALATLVVHFPIQNIHLFEVRSPQIGGRQKQEEQELDSGIKRHAQGHRDAGNWLLMQNKDGKLQWNEIARELYENSN
jgi:hypothetical protein